MNSAANNTSLTSSTGASSSTPSSSTSATESGAQQQQQQKTGKATLEWRESYPLVPVSSGGVNSNLLQSLPAGSESTAWLQDEFPEIDLNTPPPDNWCTVNYFEGDLQVNN